MSDSGIPGGGSGSGQDTTVSQSEVDVLNDETSDAGDETVVSDEEGTLEEGEREVTSEEGEIEAEEPESEEEIGEEEEVEEEGEEEEELEGEPTRPSWQTIKEKYPELAKDRDFRELYFREKAFTDIYPTLGDAKEAFTKAERLDAVDAVLSEGNIEPLITDLNTDVLRGVADRILPALYKADRVSFAKAARPLIVDMLHTVMQQAERSGDDNLKKSVRNISRALTGGPDLPNRITAINNPEIEAEKNRLQNERWNLFFSQEREFLGSADKVVMRKIENMIEDGLDPRGEFNSFTRQAISERTLNELKDRLTSDEILASRLKHLHRLAQKSGFPEGYRARMVSATLERAKKLIPVLRNRHRILALGKQSAKGNTGKKIVLENERVTSGGKAGGSTSRGRIDTKRTSAEDFLNDKITYKK